MMLTTWAVFIVFWGWSQAAVADPAVERFAGVARAPNGVVLYRERLSRAQIAGILVIAAGVAALSALRA